MATALPVSSGDQAPRLALSGITKAFPGCLANDSIDLKVMPGEIHALLGENGAGKSTLVKIIYGVLEADHGEMRWEGKISYTADRDDVTFSLSAKFVPGGKQAKPPVTGQQGQ